MGFFPKLGNNQIDNPLLNRIYDFINTTAKDILTIEASFIMAVDWKNNRIYSRLGPSKYYLELSLNEGITGAVVNNKQGLYLNNVYEDKRFVSKFDQEYNRKTRNILLQPIISSKNLVIGILLLVDKKNNFSDDDLPLSISFSNQISPALENAILYDELMLSFQSLIEVLAISIDKRHPISSGHSYRVAVISELFSKHLELDPVIIRNIKIAALLHDYGKISIPDKILKKEGKLSQDEFEIMKQHVIATQEILKRVYFSNDMMQIPSIASNHHEYWDGTGYPLGLKGNDIPLGSRIIAIADTYDAITSFREYHLPSDPEIALEEIIKDSSKKFDPDLVQKFVFLFNTDEFKIIISNLLKYQLLI